VKTEPLGLSPAEFVEALEVEGVRCLAYQQGTVRMVTHKDVSAEDIEDALEGIERIASPRP
jgi:threonine aldolase